MATIKIAVEVTYQVSADIISYDNLEQFEDNTVQNGQQNPNIETRFIAS
ncbi:MAG: hypothetical protein RM368_17195 [Nostoc sp. DedSLP03]|nr:hypothetical protein [Nostoc sp. DedSLP03]